MFQLIKPSQILQPYVKHYWVLEESSPEQACIPRIYPTGFTELVLHYGDQYLQIDKKHRTALQPRFYFTGQSSSYYDLSPTGKIGFIAITFKPHASKLFFKMPVSKAENQLVAMEDVIGNSIAEVEYKLQTAKDYIQRVQLIEAFLINQLKEFYTTFYKRINYSIHKINQNRGLISVQSLAEHACLSTKQFNRKFSDFVGITPKQFTRIVRFQSAIHHQQTKSVKNLTELAYHCGYYDQAHFTNEFKIFTGYSPKEFFKMGEPHSDYFS